MNELEQCVIVIDDDIDWLKMIKERLENILSGRNVKIKTEKNFEEALPLIKRLINENYLIIAVFVDLCNNESKMIYDGKNIIFEIHKKYPEITVIIVTHHGEKHIEEGLENGADDYIRKEDLNERMTTKSFDSWIDKHDMKDVKDNYQYTNWLFNLLIQILNHFNNFKDRIVIKKCRYDSREAFSFKDEHDLQDMFFTILGPVFPEIVPEETISKTGGKSSRADFYIPEVRTIIELKFIPDNSKIKGLFSQLNDDLTLYSEKVEAEKIIFYIQRNPNTDLTKFQPIINKFRNINHIREGKRWKLIDCIVRPM